MIARRLFQKFRNRLLAGVVRQIDQHDSKAEDKLRHLQYTLDQTRTELNNGFNTFAPRIMPISSDEMIAKLFDGTKIFLDPRDMAVAPQLGLDGIWEGWITYAWLSAVEHESVIFDVGANFGYYGILAAQRLNRKKSRVVFFEPNPHLGHYIKKSLGINWLNENAKIEQLGIADKPGHAELHILRDYVGSSSMHTMKHVEAYMGEKMYLEEAETAKVKTTSIDEYCSANGIDHIDLMKIDIEGYEEKAYAGMKRMIKQSPGLTIFLEFTKQSYDDPVGFYEEMKRDFKHFYLVDASGELYEPKDESYETVIGPVEDWIMLVFSHKSLTSKKA